MISLQKIVHHVLKPAYFAVLCCLGIGLVCAPHAFGAHKLANESNMLETLPFQPGETLTYEISWSNIVTAGTATMAVKEERLSDGTKVLNCIATSRSVGMVEKFYPVNDSIVSVFDPRSLQSISFDLRESHGTKKRRRRLAFDHANHTVVSTLNENPPLTLAVPDHVQDALSSLFYLRTREDFTIGKVHVIDVHDSGKNWSVEVHTLGREKVTTPAGEFDTIKVKTFPKYEGVFMNKGEIYIWLTDDTRKIPVLMKSTISIGSIMTTLTDMRPGETPH